jgi:hypothetical protein
MKLYALVASDTRFAVDVFPTRELAVEALAVVLADEPAYVDLLSIETVDEPVGESTKPN